MGTEAANVMAEPMWIDAPDARSAADLMRESIGHLRARLVECSGGRWRVVLLPDGAQLPAVHDVITLVRCWLSRLELSDAVVHIGLRRVTVRAVPAACTASPASGQPPA